VTKYDLPLLARQFRMQGEPIEIAPVPVGHINDTYVVTTQSRRYVLQRINQIVFKNPVQVMANVVRITEHIHSKGAAARQLEVIATRDDGRYYGDTDGNVWRMYNFIENAVTYDALQSAALAREAARMFGWFQRTLIDLPGSPLYETIVGFHDTPRRFARFQEVLKADVANRAKNAKREIDFVFKNAAICHVLFDLVQRGEVPVRIAHNDAKINNVMFDTSTSQGVCVIDLDTVMPGLSAYDFGDLVRTATCATAEDERDLSQVAVDIALFEALARGFIEGTSHFLTPAERQHLVFGGKLITFEQLIRFLTDYLADDVYYKVHREGHNLDRSRTQMKLVQSIIEHEEHMNGLVKNAFREAST
jgi:aminoglycoside phosphotransferase (APT) family kinase protein